MSSVAHRIGTAFGGSLVSEIIRKLAKGFQLSIRRRFFRAALRHGVAAAVEHLEAIRRAAPATLLDVGANKGQFSLAVRVLCPHARIIAFEPLPEAAETYTELFAGDDRVVLHCCAIADREGLADFHVTNRADSSSLFRPGQRQDAAFGVHAAGTITVPVRRLSSLVDPAGLARPILLKIDVQGAELEVVKSCTALSAVDWVYAELSFVELYEDQPLADQFCAWMQEQGFVLEAVYNRVETAAFGLTQADFLFRRDERATFVR